MGRAGTAGKARSGPPRRGPRSPAEEAVPEPEEAAGEGGIEAVKRRLNRLALDVHDGPMQNLAVIGFSLGDLRRKMHALVPADHHSGIDAGMEQISDELGRVESELRALIGALEHGAVTSVPVVDAIEIEIAEFSRRSAVVAGADGRGRRPHRDRLAADRPPVGHARRARERREARRGEDGEDPARSAATTRSPSRSRTTAAASHADAPAEEGPLRPHRHARAGRDARRQVRDREPPRWADDDHRHAGDVAPLCRRLESFSRRSAALRAGPSRPRSRSRSHVPPSRREPRRGAVGGRAGRPRRARRRSTSRPAGFRTGSRSRRRRSPWRCGPSSSARRSSRSSSRGSRRSPSSA